MRWCGRGGGCRVEGGDLISRTVADEFVGIADSFFGVTGDCGGVTGSFGDGETEVDGGEIGDNSETADDTPDVVEGEVVLRV